MIQKLGYLDKLVQDFSKQTGVPLSKLHELISHPNNRMRKIFERARPEAQIDAGDARIERAKLSGRVLAIKACITKEVEDQVKQICNRNVEILSVPFTPLPPNLSSLYLDLPLTTVKDVPDQSSAKSQKQSADSITISKTLQDLSSKCLTLRHSNLNLQSSLD